MKKFLAFLPLLLLLACSPDKHTGSQVQLPVDSIIPEAQMVLLLADAHSIEAAMTIQRNRGANVKELAEYYYAGLFRKFGVSLERYQQNLDYYREDPDLFINLYEQVNKELASREKNFINPLPE